MLKHALVAAFAAISFAGVAAAQTSPAPPAPAPSPSMSSTWPPPISRGSPFMQLDMATRFSNQNYTDQSRLKATPAEWRRANQAAMLINEQRCANAYTLAVVELDDRLAKNVKRVCQELAQQ
jgi:hypothetical protein